MGMRAYENDHIISSTEWEVWIDTEQGYFALHLVSDKSKYKGLWGLRENNFAFV